MSKVLILSVVAAALLVAAAPAAAERECPLGMDFVVIQPGQPGSPEQALPVMQALGERLQALTGLDGPMRGEYCNTLKSALPLIEELRPAWGIVSLPFYARYARQLDMTPLASTRPGGENTDVWRLMSRKPGVEDWKDLTGTVSGTMLHLKHAASCLLFGAPADTLPFKLEGTSRPLSALQAASQGDAAGVVLDGAQHSAVGALPYAKPLRVVHASKELPTSPVVWFGNPDERAAALAEALQSMAGDEESAEVLQLLQTEGFAPPAEVLDNLITGDPNGPCFP
jgi:hypothetical protein